MNDEQAENLADDNTPDDILEDAKEKFQRASDAEADNRRDALDDLRFARLSQQWPDAIKKERDREQRPCLTINRLPAYIRQVVNDARQNKPAIKCHPVDEKSDQETATILNGLIRNIEYTSDADVAYDTALEAAVTSGFGYWRVNIEYTHDDTFERDLIIERINNAFSVYGDPDSTAADSSDWNYCFVTEMITKEEFSRRWKDNKPVDWSVSGYKALSSPWFDDENVLVCEYWIREPITRSIFQLSDGSTIDATVFDQSKDIFSALNLTIVQQRDVLSHRVVQYLMTGAEVLERNVWAGRYIPIVPVYGDEVNVEGVRYFRSLIRDAKDSQMMFNYWRTTATEIMALSPKAPFIGRKGSFNSDIDKWSTANTTNHAFIEYDGQEPPQRQAMPQPATGMLQEAVNASEDIKAIIGIFDPALGKPNNETSGKAILARQRESDTSTFHFIDNLNRAIRHTGRILVDLIPSVYNSQRIIRILGDDKKPQNIPIGQPTINPQGIERIYDLTVGKYDVTVESGASFTTKREEAANQMLEFMRIMPQSAPMIADLLAKNLDWAGADEVAQRFAALLPPQAMGQNPQVMQLQQQLQQQQQQFSQQMGQIQQDLQMTKGQLAAAATELQKKELDKQVDIQKLQIDGFKAETDRLKITQVAMSPEQVQALVNQSVQQILNSPDVLPITP